MKRTKAAVLTITIFAAFFSGCASSVNAPAPETPPPAAEEQEAQEAQEPQEALPPAEAPSKQYKIGIITGTMEDCPEEYESAAKMKEKYGDIIEISLYPDIFQPKLTALLANMRALADGGAQAIVISPCGPGVAEAMDNLRQWYPDMLFISGSTADTPEQIAASADMVLNVAESAFAPAIIRQARKMGAKVFVHYTFARHMGDEAYSNRRDLFMQACEEEGIQFVDATIPDPEDEGGEAASIEYVKSDVPKMVAAYGKDTAFYATEESVQETLINSVLWEGALFPVQCVMSPFFAYPGALGIEIPYDKTGDVSYVLEQIQNQIIAKGGEGRFSTLPIIVNTVFIEVGAEYANGFLKGDIKSRNDSQALEKICGEVTEGVGMEFSNYESPSGKTLENYYIVLPDFINF